MSDSFNDADAATAPTQAGGRPPADPDPAALERIAGLDDGPRRVALLELLARHGHAARPRWHIGDPQGFVYFPGIAEEAREVLEADLDFLAQRDYLRGSFFDRLTRCPVCASYVLNIREVCVSCGSANIAGYPLLHHFRCGYVAPVTAFGETDTGARICPKCNGRMTDLGTDHEVVGEQFTCNACLASFDEPDVEALCLNCETRTPADKLTFDEVRTYEMTRLGTAAARAGRLFESAGEQLFEGDLPAYRASVIRALLFDEARRRERYKIPYSLLIVRGRPQAGESGGAASGADDSDAALTRAARQCLRDVDQLGRLAPHLLLASLPSTDMEGAERAAERLRQAAADVGLPPPEVEARTGPEGEAAIRTLFETLGAG